MAVSRNGIVQSILESTDKNSHAERVTIFIEKAVREAGVHLHNLDAVAVSMGPGSYTGLRIGVSSAKGLCFALNKPLIAVGTLHALALGMKYYLINNNFTISAPLFCPMIDARRMEVYTAIFDKEMNIVQDISASIIDEYSFSELLKTRNIVFAGDGAEKCRLLFSSNDHAHFISGFSASARFMAHIAEEKYVKKEFEDVAYFEPFYLKDFVSGIPKVKGLK